VQELINCHVTIDVDWAEDEWIDRTRRILRSNRCPCTWFITHESEAIHQLLDDSSFEIGIHPNISNLSTKSSEYRGCISDLIALCSSHDRLVRCVRTHKLVQSTDILYSFVTEYDLRVDASIIMPEVPNLKPHILSFGKGADLWRVPYFWQDDFEMRRDEEFYLPHHYMTTNDDGLKIFNFHPVHIYFNHSDFEVYADRKEKRNFRYERNGIVGDMFEELTSGIGKNGKTLSEIVYRESRNTW